MHDLSLTDRETHEYFDAKPGPSKSLRFASLLLEKKNRKGVMVVVQ